MRSIRRTSQILFLLFFLFLFITARYPYSGDINSALFLRFSPLALLFDFIQTLSISVIFWPALIILLLTPVFGRFFCGWICPLGTVIDTADHLLKSPENLSDSKWEKFKYLKYALLFGFIILAVFSIHIWGYLDPLSLINRTLAVFLYPVFTLLFDNILISASDWPLIGGAAESAYDFFKEIIMPEEQANYQQLFWITAVFIIIILLEKITRRFWCRYVCPLGALLGIFSIFRFFGRKVSEDCPSCSLCVAGCKMGAVPAENPEQTDTAECIQCLNCSQNCPSKINAVTYGWYKKPVYSPIDFDRRRFLQTAAGSALVLGMMNLGLARKKDEAWLIRPPGSLPEEDFLNTCIHCLQCVRICESNGGCLQPDQIHFDLRQLWSPVADMRGGYCEYNCNLCGLVCPTQAILPVTLKQKQETSMGLARFDKNACIPFEKNEDCIVCEEHCPTGDKAIKFNIKPVKQKDGSFKEVKYPYVIPELCIGCGICEHKCPLPGMPGIFVTTENQKRLTKADMIV